MTGDWKHQRALLIMRASDSCEFWVRKSLVRLDMRVASPRSAQPFLCPVLESWLFEGRIRLDMREPYSLAVRQLPSLPLLCPELEEFPCAEPDQARRARCLSSQFGIARVLLTCACDECTSKTA